MSVLIFIIVLGVLIFVHELGHFLIAKWAGVRVDEFGFGYPPRALKLGRKWGTLFTLNWIPFGGFVKIFGENYEEGVSSFDSSQSKKEMSRGLNFTQISKKWQAAILAAGVFFNIIFAWLLFSFGFIIGLPTPVDNDLGIEVKNPVLTITNVMSDFPADRAGLKSGDIIEDISGQSAKILPALTPENVSDFIMESSGEIKIRINRGGEILNFEMIPEIRIDQENKIVGINMDMVGMLSLPLHRAIYEGGKTTLELSYLTVDGIAKLIKDAVKGKADISQIAGPVGIVSLVGDASRLGLVYLITFTALISINLAVINLVPFPALDGGRIVLVIIEGVVRKKINPKFVSALNTISFFILIALMLFITYRDVLRLF